MTPRLRPALCFAAAAALALGCTPPPPPSAGAAPAEMTPRGGKADEAGAAPGEVVALALSQLDPAAADLDPAALLGVQPLPGAAPVSVDLRATVLGAAGSLGARVLATQAGALRVDRYALSAAVGPGQATWQGAPLRLPVRLSGGGHIEVARLFADAAQAARAPMPQLTALPFDAERARALPEGVVFSLPVEARLALNADGRLMHALANDDARLGEFARGTALGQASSVAQALLLVSGRATLQVARLSADRVRLRWRLGASAEASGQLSASSDAALTATLLPSDVLDRARALRRALDAGRLSLHAPQTAAARLERFGARAPLATRRLLDLAPGAAPDAFEQRAEATADAAAHWAADLSQSLGALEAPAIDRAAATLGRASDTLSRLERLAVRSLALRAAITLNAAASRKLGLVADYEVDLADPEAAAAFERAVSGRVLWRGPSLDALVDGAALLDLTTLDALADAPTDPERPAVTRLAVAASDLRATRFGLSVDTPFLRTAFSREDTINRVTLREGVGAAQAWEARLFTQEQVPGFGETTHQSGYFAPASGDLSQAGYLFGWRRAFGPWAAQPAYDALDEAVNLLGRRGVALGVPALFAGEHPGEVRVALDVALTGDALRALFDAERATPAVLWRALGVTAETFDNRFGLPYLTSTRRPAVVYSLPEAADACERVAAEWGGRWCLFFAEELLPALDEARASADPLARMRFLERFYRAGLLANPIGARLLVRYLSEVLYELDQAEGVHVRLALTNASDASAAASPGLQVGESPGGALLEALGVGQGEAE